MRFFPANLCACLALLLPAAVAWGDLFDQGWQSRRPLEVNWDADHASGRELATADFYAPGAAEGATDMRVTQDDGKIIPSHILKTGPGDWVRLVFALTPGQTRYYAYFGNANAPPPPSGTQDVRYTGGLMVEFRKRAVGRYQTMNDFVPDWDRAGPVIGQVMVDNLFYGLSPFGEPPWAMSKWTGCLSIPIDGDYFFAGAMANGGLVCLDGQPVWYIQGVSKDARFNITLHLRRGWHDFVLYGGAATTLHTSIAWRIPGAAKLEVIPRNAFGFLGHAQIGGLQVRNLPFVADFHVHYLGEAFVAGNYSHRYRLSAFIPTASSVATVKYDWDFGDGQTGGGAELEHVYLTAGVYPVRLTVHLGLAKDSRVTRLAVDRDWSRLDQPSEDPPFLHARDVTGYDVSRLPESCLPWMAVLSAEGGQVDAQAAATRRLAEVERHANPAVCMSVLQRLAVAMETAGKAGDAAALWGSVPASSDLQPDAAATEAEVRCWWLADFPGALKATQRLADSPDPMAQRARAMALVMSGRGDDGRRILQDLQDQQEKAGVHLAAVGGAMARTVEFRVAQGDWENGDADWDTWQARCPADFMEGYSAVLRVKLMVLQQVPVAAAAAAEAFAAAVPDSPYAPELLDMASKLWAQRDPAKSAQLRQTLQSKYPEDSAQSAAAIKAGRERPT